MIKSSKMRDMRRRMQILYSRFFISSNLLPIIDGVRHPTTEYFLNNLVNFSY